MAEKEKVIDVYASWSSSCPIVGKLYCALSRGEQVYSFEFSDSWLSNFSYILLDPDLYALRGRQYVPSGKKSSECFRLLPCPFFFFFWGGADSCFSKQNRK